MHRLRTPDGITISYDSYGNGPPLVLVHGAFSDHDTIVDSIRQRLFVLPDDTVVHTGHGEDTTIGAE